MDSKRIVFGIGVVLMVLVVFTTSASAINRVYFVPDPSNGMTDDRVNVHVYADIDASDNLASFQITVNSSADCIDPYRAYLSDAMTCGTCPQETGHYCWMSGMNQNTTYPGSIFFGAFDPHESYYDTVDDVWMWKRLAPNGIPGGQTLDLAKLRIWANGTPGVSQLDFRFEYFPNWCPVCQGCELINCTSGVLDTDWQNSVFTHMGLPELFEKDLVLGWNLISLPLTPVDNSTSAVLENDTIEYDVVYRYNATAKQFECPSTMDPGIGYFVNVTTAGTWNYTGTAYTSMNIELKQGLNCIGWVNTSADLPDAMTSISGNYRYVAGWDADDSKYGVYDANAPAGVPEFIDFTTMERGDGYWIATKEDCTLDV